MSVENEDIAIDRRRKPKPNNSVKKEEIAICPTLISKNVGLAIPPPSCQCPSWAFFHDLTGKRWPYKTCSPGEYNPTFPEDEDDKADEYAGRTVVWGIYEYFENLGGSGVPWVSGTFCGYPSPSSYGYSRDFLLNQGINGHLEHCLYGVSGLSDELQEQTILSVRDIYNAFGIILVPPMWEEPGIAEYLLFDNAQPDNVKQVAVVSGFRLSDNDFLEGYVATTDPGEYYDEAPQGSLWRSQITYAFESDFELGGAYEEWASFKNRLKFVENSSGVSLTYFCNLRRILAQSTWVKIQDTDLCEPPPELDDLGKPPGPPEEGETGPTKYLMTRYYIDGLGGEPFELPFQCRADDPNSGLISYNHEKAEIYVVIRRGTEKLRTYADKAVFFKDANETFILRNDGYPARCYSGNIPTSDGTGIDESKTVDKKIYLFPDDFLNYNLLYSHHAIQSLTLSVRACKITLITLGIEYIKNTGTYSISLKANQSYEYKNGESIPDNPNNWKHRYMINFLIGTTRLNDSANGGKGLGDLSFDQSKYLVVQNRPPNLIEIRDYVSFGKSWAFGLDDDISISSFKQQGINDVQKMVEYFSIIRRLKVFQNDKIDRAVLSPRIDSFGLIKNQPGDNSNEGYKLRKSYRAASFSFMPNFMVNQRDSEYEGYNYHQEWFKRKVPEWMGNGGYSPSWGDFEHQSAYADWGNSEYEYDEVENFPQGIYSYYEGRMRLAANLVKDAIWVMDYNQVDKLKKSDTVAQKQEKLGYYKNLLAYELMINPDNATKFIRKVKLIRFDANDKSNINTLTEFMDSDDTVKCEIYPFKYSLEDMGYTIWGGAPGPRPK